LGLFRNPEHFRRRAALYGGSLIRVQPSGGYVEQGRRHQMSAAIDDHF
jgi:hypothetical protein